MLLSQFIRELQIIQGQSGDVEVSLYDPTDGCLEEATLELVTKPGSYRRMELEEGCRCLSCWKAVDVPVPFLLVT